MLKENKTKRLVDYVFLLGLLIIGLLTCVSYGVYLDYDTESKILFSNIKEYGTRLFPESDLIQTMSDQGIVEISKSIEKDHGVALYYPIFLLFEVFSLSGESCYMLWKIYTFILFFVGLFSLYHLIKNMFQNQYIASLVTLLFWFNPRIFAESHYNNKDIVLLSMTVSVLYFGFCLLKNPSIQNIVIYACLGAFATNIKIIGAWIFGISGIYVLLYYIFTKQFNRQLFYKIVLCVIVYISVFLLITPATWDNVIEFISYLIGNAVNFSRWNYYLLFNGKLIHHIYTGMPRKYLVVMVLLTTPVVMLILMLVGMILLMLNVAKKHSSAMWLKEGYVLTIMFVGAFPFAFAVLKATPLYNGWRHFYFSYASMIILVAYACNYLYECMKKNRRIVFQGIGIVYVVILASGIIMNYPQEHSYYNVLAGEDIEKKYELDYWSLSSKQALEMIDEERGDEIVKVAALNLPTFWGVDFNNSLINESTDGLHVVSDLEKWQEADFVVANTTYVTVYSQEDYAILIDTYNLIGKIYSYDNVICEIYRKNNN